jgi:hypothetical protein
MQKSVDGSISKEAQVIAGGECLYWTSVQPLMEIRRIEMKNGRPMRGTRSRRLNPFTLPVATSSIVMTELTDLNVFRGKRQVIEEFELKDGRYRAYFVGNDFNRSLWSDPRRLDEPSQETSWLAPERYATVAMRTKIQVLSETVPIGSRVPTKNPNRFEVDPQPEPDQATWAKVSITVERSDGGIVDAQIIRPRSWILESGLCAGRMLPLNLPELEVSGLALVASISKSTVSTSANLN